MATKKRPRSKFPLLPRKKFPLLPKQVPLGRPPHNDQPGDPISPGRGPAR